MQALLELKFVQLAVEGAAADPQKLGGKGFVVVGFFEGARDELLFRFFKGDSGFEFDGGRGERSLIGMGMSLGVSVSPWERTTILSMQLRSSRTLPGQG